MEMKMIMEVVEFDHIEILLNLQKPFQNFLNASGLIFR